MINEKKESAPGELGGNQGVRDERVESLDSITYHLTHFVFKNAINASAREAPAAFGART